MFHFSNIMQSREVKFFPTSFPVPVYLIGLFLICFLFQIHVAFQITWLYRPLQILFFLEILIVMAHLVPEIRNTPLLGIAFAFIFLIRLPFLFHADGLLFTSDNALEALQCLHIQETHQAPFFLLNAINHNGTLSHLLVAFLWDLTGSHYVVFVFFQILIYTAFLMAFYSLMKNHARQAVLGFLLLFHFSFLSVLFDYSLYLRAGPYLQALFLIVLGISLFEPSFSSPVRLFFSLYFVFFSLYINHVGIFFAFSFLVVVLLLSIQQRTLFKFILIFSLSSSAAGFHWLVAWIKRMIPSASSGEWFRVKVLPLSDLLSSRLGSLLIQAGQDFLAIFIRLFRFELNYLLQFFVEDLEKRRFWLGINSVLIAFSLVAFLYAVYHFGKKWVTDLAHKRLSDTNWLTWLFFLLFAAEFAKILFLLPSRFVEPRHHLDFVFLLLIGYVVFFSHVWKVDKHFSTKSLIAGGLLLLFLVPHYHFYYRQTLFKEDSYRKIINILESNDIHFLSTDFIIAYPLYFLSGKKILVSNSLGPLTIRFFFPEIDRIVDRVPADRKAYLFFSKDYHRERWHKDITSLKKKELMTQLHSKGISFRIIQVNRHQLLIPKRLIRRKYTNQKIEKSSEKQESNKGVRLSSGMESLNPTKTHPLYSNLWFFPNDSFDQGHRFINFVNGIFTESSTPLEH